MACITDGMLRLAFALLLLLLSMPAPLQAQSPRAAFGAGAGGTYYCIVSRCDTGASVGVSGDVRLSSFTALNAAIHRHFCSDCDRFTMAELALLVQPASRRLRPFAGAGVSFASDPEFMGSQVGPYAMAGVTAGISGRVGLRMQIDGRKVGRGDAMGGLGLIVMYALQPTRKQ